MNETNYGYEGNLFYLKNTHSSMRIDEAQDMFLTLQSCIDQNQIDTKSTIVLDFSNITFWEISSVLWIVIAVDHFIKLGNKNIESPKELQCPIEFIIKIKLPKPSIEDKQFDLIDKNDISEIDKKLLKSVDFLRRWKISEAFKNFSDDPHNDPMQILFNEEKEYFLRMPFKYYKAAMIGDKRSELSHELISLNLVEIRNLVDFDSSTRKIEREQIDKNIDLFINKAVAPVLINHCEISEDAANKFVTHLLSEGIENAFQHPNASIGMFSLVKKKDSNKLLLVIADNGEPIPKTIYPHFYFTNKFKKKYKSLSENYSPDNYDTKLLGEIIIHATKDGVSRKGLDEIAGMDYTEAREYLAALPKRGEGLTHIRDCTVKDFNGVVNILTQGIQLKCKSPSVDGIKGVAFSSKNFRWAGNLIELELTVKEK